MALVAVSRLARPAQAFAAARNTLTALVQYVVIDGELAAATTPRLVRYFGGDPWVARESPVSSVDDTVTAAVSAAGL